MDFTTPRRSVLPAGTFGEPTHSLTGTKHARFVNRYSPAYDTPYEHAQLNTGVYLDEELLDELTEDRRAGVRYHLVADKVFKAYQLERKSFASIMRS
ncbi:hypothetical protein NESM_000582200 [Novymonas esmeraldas]|uniref:Uncharacterized protein n=1 Tax=Novymonas esmeraldas TaxID=1808958 RepID=A0AAW0EQZ1_9TRYP